MTTQTEVDKEPMKASAQLKLSYPSMNSPAYTVVPTITYRTPPTDIAFYPVYQAIRGIPTHPGITYVIVQSKPENTLSTGIPVHHLTLGIGEYWGASEFQGGFVVGEFRFPRADATTDVVRALSVIKFDSAISPSALAIAEANWNTVHVNPSYLMPHGTQQLLARPAFGKSLTTRNLTWEEQERYQNGGAMIHYN